MTQAEWDSSHDPLRMLDFLRSGASDHKLRLFACACVRRVAHLMLERRGHRAAEVAERFADGQAAYQELRAVWVDRVGANWDNSGWATLPHAAAAAHEAACYAARAAAAATRVGRRAAARDAEWAAQASLLRDLFNPFRPVQLVPSVLAWGDGAVVRLARSVYDGRSFDGMPVLADALEEAGCTDEAVLSHCRQPGVHIRGCWALDLLTGRE